MPTIPSTALTIVSEAILSSAPNLLESAMPALARLIGYSGDTTNSGVLSAVKDWVGHNPNKVALVANQMAMEGINFSVDAIRNALGKSDSEDPSVIKLLMEVENNMTVERQELVGDGDPLLYHGEDPEDAIEGVLALNIRMLKIKDAIRAIGSLDALKAVREVVFMEDVDFDLFLATRNF